MEDRVVEELRQLISRELLEGQDVGLDRETPLLELGLIDSLSIRMILKHVQDVFGLTIPVSALTPDNFRTLGTIGSLVARLA
ncbi:MAG TPA: acyl carrier protein [Kofleriaceae bacterium]|nr:acyl carrier protein [Kofleriaceae bacterium]